MDRSRYEDAWKSWLCRGCMRLKSGVRRLDLVVKETVLDDAALNTVFGTGVGIARRDFLLSLGDTTVREHLHVGKLFGSTGEPFGDWVTFHGKHPVVVRGSKQASFRICEGCGRPTYFAMGKKYLYPRPPSGVPILDKFDGGLVVTEEIVKRVSLNRWRKVNCVKLPVLLAPKDSLPELVVV